MSVVPLQSTSLSLKPCHMYCKSSPTCLVRKGTDTKVGRVNNHNTRTVALLIGKNENSEEIRSVVLSPLLQYGWLKASVGRSVGQSVGQFNQQKIVLGGIQVLVVSKGMFQIPWQFPKNTKIPILLLLTNYLVKQKFTKVKASFLLFNIKFAEEHNFAIFKPVLMNTNCSVNYSLTYHSKVTHMSSQSFAAQSEYQE